MRDRWHVVTAPGRHVLARRLPVRFDVAARTVLPKMRKERLALQVRQDLWRVLKDLRGFSPVVEVRDLDDGVEVTAGGAVDGACPRAVTEARIGEMLEDPARRARWCRWARVVLAGLALPALSAGLAKADPVPVDVPSGHEVALVDVLLDEAPGALWARFRFVAPELGQDIGPDAAADDMDHLCSAVAVPYLSHHRIQPARIVVSLSDRPVAFGTKAPEATQYFEAYTYRDGTCIWEAF